MRVHEAEKGVPGFRLAILLALSVSLAEGIAPAQQSGYVTGSPYQGSTATEQVVPGVRSLSLAEAIQMGLKYNLGLVLAGENSRVAHGQRMQTLQALLPAVNANAREAVQQTNLQAEGLRIPGFPAVIGPYGYTDIRVAMQWSLANVSSLQNYLAARHNFEGATLSERDARDMVVLTVGNAYLVCISDASRVQSANAQVSTSKLSLDQANANHQAGTAPLLDVLRAQVDYQTQQQSLIVAQNQYEKDKIALARAIGMSLEQKFELTDELPYASLDNVDPNSAVQQAL
ncbi:MAG TPA: TolC family protein, partial [Acidobacteriaceae bacterium]|nr:TolC family protein [Acidobacteriaceae bacterium]